MGQHSNNPFLCLIDISIGAGEPVTHHIRIANCAKEVSGIFEPEG
jgi:hypothetical protein